MSTIVDTEELRYLLNRRKFLAGSAALAAVPLMPWQALAQAAPHTFKQGDAEIVVLTDGPLEIPWSVVAPEASHDQIAEISKRLGISGPNAVASTNVVVVKSGSDMIMFDNGCGPNFAPTAGKLGENMAAAGLDPAAITKVVFTHAHPDHVFGTLKGDGALLFPNAAYYAGETEWGFWTDPGLAGKMPVEMGGMIQGVQANLGAVKDRVTMVKGGSEFLPGITAVDTPGHTPGHLSFLIAGGEGLLLTGDATTNQIISFEHPEWKFAYDAISDMAIATRKSLLDRLATDKTKLLGYHFAYPGIGFAEKKDSAYVYVAAA
jgi:glyoxylase-like metal-dependent hydrolase (beta-lactamase superfamily II)